MALCLIKPRDNFTSVSTSRATRMLVTCIVRDGKPRRCGCSHRSTNTRPASRAFGAKIMAHGTFNFLHPPVNFLFYPNYSFSILFSNTTSLLVNNARFAATNNRMRRSLASYVLKLINVLILILRVQTLQNFSSYLTENTCS
jgi:hypothetical protein